MPPSDCPDVLIVGHLTRDLTAQGPVLGGTAAYAAVTTARLGYRPAVLTGYGPDVPALDALDGLDRVVVEGAATTTFENTSAGGQRRQRWLARGPALNAAALPDAWRRAPVVHLAPVAQELAPGMLPTAPGRLVGATGQGWLRGRDASGRVTLAYAPDLPARLAEVDVLLLSLADVHGDRSLLETLLHAPALGIETLGASGCTLYQDGGTTRVPTAACEEVDPTGAGDVFAAAFLVRYHEVRDPLEAARFANACAGLAVGGTGLDALPDRAAVEARLRNLPAP